MVIDGSTLYVDIIFRRLKLVIEIDGRLYHTGTEVFESDRWRQNLLVLNGWCVLRFTWTMIEDHPEKGPRDGARGDQAAYCRGALTSSSSPSWTGPNGNRGS